MKSSRIFFLILTASLAVFSCGSPGADPDDIPEFKPNEKPSIVDPVPEAGVVPPKDGFLAMGFVKDAETGNGIPNVVVSDGWNCVKTDSKGIYYLPAKSGKSRAIFVITPGDYEPPMTDGIFSGYVKRGLKATAAQQFDFTLRKRSADAAHFKALMVADIQINKNGQYYDTAREFFRGVKEMYQNEPLPTYIFSLGDLVFSTSSRNAVSQSMDDYKKFISSSGLPSFQVIGNHDHWPQAKAPFYEATDGYYQRFGPVNYAVNIGGIHFVILDDMDWGEYTDTEKAFHDGLNDEAVAFLQNDLALVPKTTPVMVCMHVPMTWFKGSSYWTTLHHKEFMTALSRHDVHVWYGHTHHNANYVYTSDQLAQYGIKSMSSHSVARSCGGLYMAGRVFSTDGVPWNVVEVEFNGKSLTYHQKTFPYTCPNTTYKAEFSDDVWAIGPDLTGDGYVWCNPYMYDNAWSLPEWWENGTKVSVMEDMSLSTLFDPYYLWACTNVHHLTSDDEVKHAHLFRVKPSEGVKEGEVHVTDRFGNAYVRKVSW